MTRLALLLSLALLAGCEPRPVEQAVETVAAETQPALQAAETAAAEVLPDLAEPLPPVAAVEAPEPPPAAAEPLPPPPDPLEVRRAACRAAAAALLVRWEVTSPAYYRSRLQSPVWPGGASGVTWGVGYDGGHQRSQTILDDWQAHVDRARLAETAGITGSRAKSVLPQYRDIVVPYDYAYRVFEERSLVEYQRRAERAFPGLLDLPANACGAIVCVVYNRGTAMSGDHRREMRNLKDDCIPGRNVVCIAAEIRSMKRLWIGTPIERGLSNRREAEAILATTP